MAKFKVIISDPKQRTSSVLELEDARATPLIGRKIGEIIDGSIVNLSGRKVQITGGSDKDGFPIRPNVHGGVRRQVILSGGVGFKPKTAGQRRRKTIRGNAITDEIVQINMKIVEKSKQMKEKKEKATPEKETEQESQTISNA